MKSGRYFLQDRGRESGVVNHEFIFMPSHSVQSMAKPTGSMVASLLFYLLKALQGESHYRLPNLPQPPQQSL
jgi:hypothetical protein